MAKTPVRFRPARRIAWTVTVVSIVLATWTRGDYDPTIAVLTATLIAVIWYTYWSYVAANREEASYLLLNLDAQPIELTLIPRVRNPTRRTVTARVFLELWADGRPLDIGPLYRGEEPIAMGPGEEWHGWLELAKRDQMGASIPRVVSARLHSAWTDDLRERGDSRPKHRTVDFTRGTSIVVARLGESEISQHFGALPALNVAKAASDEGSLSDQAAAPTAEG